jgi:streptogramin lyase
VDTRETDVNPTSDGLRVDWCATWATGCGQPAADQYCAMKHGSRWYALGYQAAPDVGPTLVLGDGQVCSSPDCDGFAEITCAYDPIMQDVANDLDDDGWNDAVDNCPWDANPLQENSDNDPMGDECDGDPYNEPHCSDGIDNDGDGATDADDVGCLTAMDSDETAFGAVCDDGLDNDGDGAIDTADSECSSPSDRSEGPPCADGFDDDGDGLVDLADPDCQDAADPSEFHLAGGDILVADFDTASLQRVDPMTGFTTLVYMGQPLSQPWGVALENDGGILVTDYADRLVRIDAEAGTAEIVSEGGLLRRPRGLALHADGRVLVADDQANGIVAIDPADGSQELFAPGPYGASIDYAVDVLFGGDFDLVFATDSAPGVDRVVTIDPNSGDVLPPLGGEWGDPLGSPWGMAFDLDGSVLVVDSSQDRVVRVSPYNTRIVETYDAWSLQDPRKIAVEESGTWIVSDSGGIYGTNWGEVYRLDPVSGSQTLLTGAIDNPNGLAIVPVRACGDGVDNDGDGAIDLADPDCSGVLDVDESGGPGGSRCGLGFEQAILLPMLFAVRRRMRTRRTD